MQHIKLTRADLDAIQEWIGNGAHLFPYQGKRPSVNWGSEWLGDVDQAVYANDAGHNIAYDIVSARAVMIDIDNLLPMPADDMLKAYDETIADRPDIKLQQFIDIYKRRKKAEWKALGILECRRRLEIVRQEVAKHLPAHIEMPSTSGFGHHFYYHIHEPAEGEKLCYPSGNIEIFANRHPSYPLRWADLKGFHANPPLALQQVVDFWRPIDQGLNEIQELRRQVVARIPAPEIKVSADNRISNYDYQAYLDRNGRGVDQMNNRLNAWVFRASQLDDPEQVEIARAEALAHGHDRKRTEDTIKSAWAAGQLKPYTPFVNKKRALDNLRNNFAKRSI